MSEQEVTALKEQVKTLFANDDRIVKDLDEVKQDVKDCNKELIKEIKALREEIKALYNRLPVWATLAFGVLCTVIGGMIGKGV